MVKNALGDITVEPHEETGGIRIERETPELSGRTMGPVIVPGGNLNEFADEVAEAAGKELVDSEIAQLVESLRLKLCE